MGKSQIVPDPERAQLFVHKRQNTINPNSFFRKSLGANVFLLFQARNLGAMYAGRTGMSTVF
jgi:hypothetical protein